MTYCIQKNNDSNYHGLLLETVEIRTLQSTQKEKKNYQPRILYLVLHSINMAPGSHPFDPVEGGQRKGNHCEKDK